MMVSWWVYVLFLGLSREADKMGCRLGGLRMVPLVW